MILEIEINRIEIHESDNTNTEVKIKTNAPDSSNQEYKHAWDADQMEDFTQMEVPDCSFPPVALSFQLASQCKTHRFFFIVLFYVVCFWYLFWSYLETNGNSWYLCPCFCMTLKECMQPRILEYMGNISQKTQCCFAINSVVCLWPL